MSKDQDKIQTTIDTFTDAVSAQDLTPLETLGVLSFLTALYHNQIMGSLIEEFEKTQS